MAIQLASVAKYLTSKEVSFKQTETHIIYPFDVETTRGKTDALMVFSAPVDGQVFSVESVNFLPGEVVQGLMQNLQFLQSILKMAWRTPYGGCELGDGNNGPELRFVVEVPLMDATLTEAQFQTVVNGVKNGTQIVCELVLEALGKGGEEPQADLETQLKAAAAVLVGENSSREEKKKAFDFVVAVAESKEVPAEVRASAARLLELIQKTLEEMEKAKSNQSSPFA